jgi:hypothetical protein
MLKSVREKKEITYKGKLIKITADFLTETLKARRAWSEVSWAMNKRIISALGYSTQQNYHSKLMETKTIYDHQHTTTEDSIRNFAHRR